MKYDWTKLGVCTMCDSPHGTCGCAEAWLRGRKMNEPRTIFVFGSNLRGYHGAGSAEAAVAQHGAVWGQARGLQGNSYAIPTKEANIWQSRPLGDICKDVRDFLAFARNHESWSFNIVKVGCGLAGYKEDQIAPFFAGAPPNCNLPPGWRSILLRLDKSNDSSGEVQPDEA